MPNCRHSSDIDASPHSQAMQNRAFSFTEQVSNHAIARTSKLERSLQTCYLSSRSILLPIIPVWTASHPLPEGRGVLRLARWKRSLWVAHEVPGACAGVE